MGENIKSGETVKLEPDSGFKFSIETVVSNGDPFTLADVGLGLSPVTALIGGTMDYLEDTPAEGLHFIPSNVSYTQEGKRFNVEVVDEAADIPASADEHGVDGRTKYVTKLDLLQEMHASIVKPENTAKIARHMPQTLAMAVDHIDNGWGSLGGGDDYEHDDLRDLYGQIKDSIITSDMDSIYPEDPLKIAAVEIKNALYKTALEGMIDPKFRKIVQVEEANLWGGEKRRFFWENDRISLSEMNKLKNDVRNDLKDLEGNLVSDLNPNDDKEKEKEKEQEKDNKSSDNDTTIATNVALNKDFDQSRLNNTEVGSSSALAYNEDVKHVQSYLKALGLDPDEIDGKHGQHTDAALKSYLETEMDKNVDDYPSRAELFAAVEENINTKMTNEAFAARIDQGMRALNQNTDIHSQNAVADLLQTRNIESIAALTPETTVNPDGPAVT